MYKPVLELQASVDKFDSFRTGLLHGELRLGQRPAAGMTVVVEVGTAVKRAFALTDSVLSFSLAVPRVRSWSAEAPYLYTVQVRLKDSGRRAEEVLTRRVSFRKVELAGENWLVNGQRVRMSGFAAAGSIARGEMAQYLGLLKQFNVNAVRRVHGADSVYWNTLCDTLGLYAVDSGRMFVGALQIPVKGNSMAGLKEVHWRDGHWSQCFITDDEHAVFSANLAPGPAAWEMKKFYQPVRTEPGGPEKYPGASGMLVKVSNDYFFRPLTHLTMEWEVMLNGVTEQRGKVSELGIGAQRSGVFRLPVKMPQRPGEALVKVSYRLKKPEGALPAGHIVASDQLLLRGADVNDVSVHPAGELVLKDEGGTFSIGSAATGLDMQFNKQTGWLQHYVVGGRSLLEDTLGLMANFWRSPTDYDYYFKVPFQLAAWRHATREPRLQLFSTSTSTDFVIVRADYMLPDVRCMLHVHYTVNAKGEMQVEEVLEVDSTQVDTAAAPQSPGGPMLPRIGMKWFLPPGYDSVTYYGRGPWENYADRNDAAVVGIYRQEVDQLLFPYSRPQECGNRTDIRWWKITDKQGHGMMIAADSALLSISALHYFGDDLDDGDSLQQRHMSDLPRRPQVQLNIDHRQMGLSGMKPYRLPFGNYHYIYKVTPL